MCEEDVENCKSAMVTNVAFTKHTTYTVGHKRYILHVSWYHSTIQGHNVKTLLYEDWTRHLTNCQKNEITTSLT